MQSYEERTCVEFLLNGVNDGLFYDALFGGIILYIYGNKYNNFRNFDDDAY